MILSRNIPLNVEAFLSNLVRNPKARLQSPDYRALLIRETKELYPGLIEGLSRVGRTRAGQERVIADADHILPQSLWPIVIPLAWDLPEPPPDTPDVLGNLFWRTVSNNRGSEKRGDALDQPYIREYKRQAAAYTTRSAASMNWARACIAFFLRTKHDEGVNIDLPINPHKANELFDGVDVSYVLAFIQKVRETHPRITHHELIKLIENQFPYIQIEIDGRGPRIEFG